MSSKEFFFPNLDSTIKSNSSTVVPNITAYMCLQGNPTSLDFPQVQVFSIKLTILKR